MNILIAAIHYPIASGRYIERAFKRLGHDVRTLGPATGRQVWGMELPPGREWQPDYPVDGSAFNEPDDWIPDLIVTADSAFDFYPTGAWKEARRVLYGVDNHVRDYKFNTPEWEYKFLAHGNGMRIDDDNTIHLSCAYDPDWFYETTPWSERMAHAAMIGVVYEDRHHLLQALGNEFRVLQGTGLIMEDFRNAYNQAVVSVCKSVRGDMAQRIFETAAMGCLILSDYCPDFDKLGFRAWEHYIPFSSIDEAVHNMGKVLYTWNEADINDMITRTKEWVKPHTWDNRCNTIMQTVFEKETLKNEA
jgi:hypothetical protein